MNTRQTDFTSCFLPLAFDSHQYEKNRHLVQMCNILFGHKSLYDSPSHTNALQEFVVD